MNLLDSLTIYDGTEPRTIELYHGDLTEMPAEHAVDALIVSAFPDSYAKYGRTLIGQLSQRGVVVRELAKDKFLDLRKDFSCWLSKQIVNPPDGIQFKRILCFEPKDRERVPEIIGDIFQSLIAVISGGEAQIHSVAMPLVATGNQKVPVVDLAEPLTEAATQWLALGLPIRTLKIVEKNELKAYEFKGAFGILKKRLAHLSARPRKFTHDLFISYAHENTSEVLTFVEELKRQKPDIQVFIDREDLNAGHAWQQAIYEALDDCEKVIAFYSPAYLASKVCKEEYNIALFRHRDSASGVLIPLYLYSANLPTYMHLVQFIDCRENDGSKLTAACQTIITNLM
jgi:hypothetical protein